MAEVLVWQEEGAPGGLMPPAVDPARPLAGLRVLDLTRVLAGPVATRFLAGFGAEVLRVDPPDWDEPGVVPDVTLGKRCARLDARTADGHARLCELLAEADVLVHGYRPGALDGLGLTPARRQAIRPGLVDVSLDAYGWTGPWTGRRGFDSLVQMSSGIADAGMRRFGTDKPTPLPVQALDHGTGYILAASVLRGLALRRDTGRGQIARASLARTAALLAASGPGDADGELRGPEAADFADDAEQTAWGPMRRLRGRRWRSRGRRCAGSGRLVRWGAPRRPGKGVVGLTPTPRRGQSRPAPASSAKRSGAPCQTMRACSRT